MSILSTGFLPRMVYNDTDGPRPWPSHWPLTAVLLGFPLWWILGLAAFMPLALAIPMAWQLARRQIVVPRGFGWWLLFLVWMFAGAFLLFADAPGAVPGGGGAGRLMVFGLRAAWYLACTVVMLWVLNSDHKQLSVRWYCQIFGFIFVFTTIGGVIGMMWPTLSITSPFEMILPSALANNGFVSSLVHLDVADIQTVLGDPEPRPTMPFAYANTWGSVMSLSLPFFVVGWFKYGRRWQRLVTPIVLVVAAAPIVYSLNRGLWFSLALGAAILVVLQLRTGRPTVIIATGVVGAIMVAALVASPLSTMVEERFAHQHSNDRRSQLLIATVESTVRGSPVAGFGNTRDVQGSFASIAGGATPDCPACGVPPLGTQGQLWMVIFSQGLLGLVFFLAFFLTAVWGVWRCRSLTDTLCFIVLAFFGLQLFVYDTLDLPMYTVMATIGLAGRERRATLATSRGRFAQLPLGAILRRTRRGLPLILLVTTVTAASGLATTLNTPTTYSASVDILLTPTPRYLALTAGSAQGKVRTITIDTEAALVFSQETLERLPRTWRSEDFDELRDRIQVTAPPNTSILSIEMRAQTAEEASGGLRALVTAYLDSRSDFLQQRREQVLNGLQGDLRDLEAAVAVSSGPSDSSGTAAIERRQRDVQQAVTRVTLAGTEAGEVIRVDPVTEVPLQPEIPTVSGALLGFAVAAIISVHRPGWTRRTTNGAPHG